MDEQQFDAFIRRFGDEAPRRRLLQTLLGVTLGGALGLLSHDPEATEAKGKGKKRNQQAKKKQGKKRAGKRQTQALRGENLGDEIACPVALDLGEPCPAKVGICHRTGSATNPVRYIEVCVNAAPAHAAHGDLVACPLPRQVIDPQSCTCVCDPSVACNGGQVLNLETCACECPPETVFCPGNSICVPRCDNGETLNTSTCQCEGVCPPGYEQDPERANVPGQCCCAGVATCTNSFRTFTTENACCGPVDPEEDRLAYGQYVCCFAPTPSNPIGFGGAGCCRVGVDCPGDPGFPFANPENCNVIRCPR